MSAASAPTPPTVPSGPGRRGPRPGRTPSPPPPGPIDGVAQGLLAEIVRGEWGRGARLPTERELAERFDASRVSVHQALHRLAAWHVIEIRPRSGAVVRPRREWKLEVLPAYLRHADPVADGLSPATMLGDALASRASLCVELVRRASGRVGPGDLDPARRAAERAWEARGDGLAFVRHDLEMTRSWLEAARMLPSVWLINNVATVYLESVAPFAGLVPVLDSYLGDFRATFDAMERGDGESAAERVRDYYGRFDRALLSPFGEAPASLLGGTGSGTGSGPGAGAS